MEAMTSFLGSLRMSSTMRWCTPKQMLFDLARDRAQWQNMKKLPWGRGQRLHVRRCHAREQQLVWATDGLEAGRKMNWAILLACGRTTAHVLRPGCELSGQGMAEVIDNLHGWLQELLGAGVRMPCIVFTGRGCWDVSTRWPHRCQIRCSL